MIASDYKDLDGFKLQFEENCPKKDKEFFIKQYPKVDLVAEKKLHCTTCDFHIGTAPISEKVIRTHLKLSVTQCNKCFAFYNSGEFGKGEDGSEYYCRWCGQGGEVFCCSTCPFVFCNKCIRSNLSSAYVTEIEENDEWSCFVCDRDILKNLRAQHWALRNFMSKQLEKIQKTSVASEDELNNLLNEDVSDCCPRKKRKVVNKPPPAPLKRPATNGSYMSTILPPAKKINIQPSKSKSPPVQYRASKSYPIRPPSTITRPGPKPKDDIVCTPDIMGLFNHEDSAIPPTNMLPSTSVAPPPLVLRNNQRPVIRAIQPNPIYHNVNGFQIDLNHASRQEIFRLPNGKLIQVRKQTAPNAQNTSGISVRPGTLIAPRGPQFTIRQAAPPLQTTARMFRPQAPLRSQTLPQRIRATGQPQQRFTFSDGRVLSTPIIPPLPAPAPAPPKPPQSSTIFTQQNGSIAVARAPQADTPFGKSKTEFEDKIISGMEICQHTINKMITLSNATSFKTSRTFEDLKYLYTHLQYLFTYTSGKLTTLQESLKTGMESLAQFDEKLKEKCDDDELEIVEQKTDVIEVMDDDEEEAAAKPQKPGPVCSKKPLPKDIPPQAENAGGSFVAHLPGITIALASSDGIADDENSNSSSLSSVIAKTVASDKKLTNKVLVKVEKLEDTKNPIIKEFVMKMKERKLAEIDSSREATPDSVEAATTALLCNEVLMAQPAVDSNVSEMEIGLELNEKEGATAAEVDESEDKETTVEASKEVIEIPKSDDIQAELISIDIDDDGDEMNVEKVLESSEEAEKKDSSETSSDDKLVVVDDKTETDEIVTDAKDSDIPEEEAEKIAEDVNRNMKEAEEITVEACDVIEENKISTKPSSESETKNVPEEENEATKVSQEDTNMDEVVESMHISELKNSTELSSESETKNVPEEENEAPKVSQEDINMNMKSSKISEEAETSKVTEETEASIEPNTGEVAKVTEDSDDVDLKTTSETLGDAQTREPAITESQVDDKLSEISSIQPSVSNVSVQSSDVEEIFGSSQETLLLNNSSIVSLDSTIELDVDMDGEKAELIPDESLSKQDDPDVMMAEPESVVSDTNKPLKSAGEKAVISEADEDQTLLNDLIETLTQESVMEID